MWMFVSTASARATSAPRPRSQLDERGGSSGHPIVGSSGTHATRLLCFAGKQSRRVGAAR
jgi:hypothetical protein